MTPLVTPKVKQATQLIMTCIIAGLCFWAAYGIVTIFSPLQPGAATSVVPGCFNELMVWEVE